MILMKWHNAYSGHLLFIFRKVEILFLIARTVPHPVAFEGMLSPPISCAGGGVPDELGDDDPGLQRHGKDHAHGSGASRGDPQVFAARCYLPIVRFHVRFHNK